MATKQFYVTKPFKFQNRMLQAGEPVAMSGPDARLYIHLGRVTPDRPTAPLAANADYQRVGSGYDPGAAGYELQGRATKPAPKAPARKRRAKKRASKPAA